MAGWYLVVEALGKSLLALPQRETLELLHVTHRIRELKDVRNCTSFRRRASEVGYAQHYVGGARPATLDVTIRLPYPKTPPLSGCLSSNPLLLLLHRPSALPVSPSLQGIERGDYNVRWWRSSAKREFPSEQLELPFKSIRRVSMTWHMRRAIKGDERLAIP